MTAFDPRFLAGIDHFNRREYFEAHEVWEDLWIEVNDERKDFYQGLIQAAVALHHAGRGNAAGATTLYRRMESNLDPYRPACEGIDLDRFLGRMEECCRPLFAEAPGPVDSKLLPTIALTGTSGAS